MEFWDFSTSGVEKQRGQRFLESRFQTFGSRNPEERKEKTPEKVAEG
jgi:hypothetical protein